MTKQEFWDIIATSGKGECEEQAKALVNALSKLDGEGVASFDRRWRELMAESYRWDLWAVAYIVNGGCSDDCFDYFRAWLIGRGQAYFEASLKDAERAADAISRGDDIECESLMYASAQAYMAVTGSELPVSDVRTPANPAGDDWEEDALPELYPKLWERFW